MKKVLILAALSALSVASQATVLYSTSFEAPTFATGTLYNGVTGQDGWQSTSAVPAITTAQAHTGTQSLNHGTRTQTGTSTAALTRWSWKDWNAGWVAAQGAGKTVLHASIWCLIPAGMSQNQQIGVQLYDNGGSAVATTWFNPSSSVLAVFPQTGTGTGYTFTPSLVGSWFQFELYANTTTLKTTYKINGLTIPTTTAFTLTNFSDFDILTNSPAGVASTASNIYWDDLNVEAVPEPGTMAALGLGAVALIRRRRSSK